MSPRQAWYKNCMGTNKGQGGIALSTGHLHWGSRSKSGGRLANHHAWEHTHISLRDDLVQEAGGRVGQWSP